MTPQPRAREALTRLVHARQQQAAQLEAEIAALQAMERRGFTLDAADAVELMLLLYLDTRSARRAAEQLNALGLLTADLEGPRPFNAADVCEVILWPAVEGDSVLRSLAQAALQG